MSAAPHAFPKNEKLCGKTTIARVMKKGHWFSSTFLRVCYIKEEQGRNRILTSVPKRYFKRAVKRNLLKRRLREAYRLQKELLTCRGTDILLVYSSKIVAEFDDIRKQLANILTEISRKAGETEKIDA